MKEDIKRLNDWLAKNKSKIMAKLTEEVKAVMEAKTYGPFSNSIEKQRYFFWDQDGEFMVLHDLGCSEELVEVCMEIDDPDDNVMTQIVCEVLSNLGFEDWEIIEILN